MLIIVTYDVSTETSAGRRRLRRVAKISESKAWGSACKNPYLSAKSMPCNTMIWNGGWSRKLTKTKTTCASTG